MKRIEPELSTDPALRPILDELIRREPIFHRPEFGTTRTELEKLAREDFWETGASGRRYCRDFVLDNVAERYASPHEDVWEASDFYCRQISETIYLLHYTLVQERVRKTRRLTIWDRTPDGWKIVYHQGTVVEES